ncbi:MAG: hypothetical protein C0618_06985 [Desulfuromonas sp.]|nr:MAG: hypothetical protein C0618_06985 [Desulfuromonas sp.]
MKNNLMIFILALLTLMLSACSSSDSDDKKTSGSISDLTEGIYILTVDGEYDSVVEVAIMDGFIIVNYCDEDEDVFTVSSSGTAVADISDLEDDYSGSATVTTFTSTSFSGTYSQTEGGITNSGTFKFGKSTDSSLGICEDGSSYVGGGDSSSPDTSGSTTDLDEGLYTITVDGEFDGYADVTATDAAITATYCDGDQDVFVFTSSGTAISNLSEPAEGTSGTATATTFSSTSFSGLYVFTEDSTTGSGTFVFSKTSDSEAELCGEGGSDGSSSSTDPSGNIADFSEGVYITDEDYAGYFSIVDGEMVFENCDGEKSSWAITDGIVSNSWSSEDGSGSTALTGFSSTEITGYSSGIDEGYSYSYPLAFYKSTQSFAETCQDVGQIYGSASDATDGVYTLSMPEEALQVFDLTITSDSLIFNDCNGEDDIFTINSSGSATLDISDEDGPGLVGINYYSATTLSGFLSFEDYETGYEFYEFFDLNKMTISKSEACSLYPPE